MHDFPLTGQMGKRRWTTPMRLHKAEIRVLLFGVARESCDGTCAGSFFRQWIFCVPPFGTLRFWPQLPPSLSSAVQRTRKDASLSTRSCTSTKWSYGAARLASKVFRHHPALCDVPPSLAPAFVGCGISQIDQSPQSARFVSPLSLELFHSTNSTGRNDYTTRHRTQLRERDNENAAPLFSTDSVPTVHLLVVDHRQSLRGRFELLRFVLASQVIFLLSRNAPNCR